MSCEKFPFTSTVLKNTSLLVHGSINQKYRSKCARSAYRSNSICCTYVVFLWNLNISLIVHGSIYHSMHIVRMCVRINTNETCMSMYVSVCTYNCFKKMNRNASSTSSTSRETRCPVLY